MLRHLLVTLVFLALLAAPSADGATVALDRAAPTGDVDDVHGHGATLTVIDSDGAPNALTIVLRPAAIVVTDTYVMPVAGAGCAAVPPATVSCPLDAWDSFDPPRGVVKAGGGDDRILLRTGSARFDVLGQDGNDAIDATATTGPLRLLGGSGDDLLSTTGGGTLRGGPGRDTLTIENTWATNAPIAHLLADDAGASPDAVRCATARAHPDVRLDARDVSVGCHAATLHRTGAHARAATALIGATDLTPRSALSTRVELLCADDAPARRCRVHLTALDADAHPAGRTTTTIARGHAARIRLPLAFTTAQALSTDHMVPLTLVATTRDAAHHLHTDHVTTCAHATDAAADEDAGGSCA